MLKEWWMYPHFSLAAFNNPLFIHDEPTRSPKKLKHQIERRKKEKLSRKVSKSNRKRGV